MLVQFCQQGLLQKYQDFKSIRSKIKNFKPLPTKNRPPTFSGAIGSFRSSYYVSKEKVNVGDPVQLTFSLEGKGNFSAIPAPVIQSNKNFKVSSPVFLFDGDKTMKFEGVQKFEYKYLYAIFLQMSFATVVNIP